MYMEDTTVEGENRMLDEFVFPAARDLATARPHVIVFGCTSAGALRGNEYEAWLTQEISTRTGIPTVSVIRSVRDALGDLSASQLVVITPYVDSLNDRIKASLEEDGSTVLRICGLGMRENFIIARVSGGTILDLARQAVADLKPDALFVSCTNLPAFSTLAELRRAFSFPVLTSNQAVLDAALVVARGQRSTS
jgi:maleate isomerase